MCDKDKLYMNSVVSGNALRNIIKRMEYHDKKKLKQFNKEGKKFNTALETLQYILNELR